MKFKNFNKYEVYSDGRIWSYSRNKFLKPQTTKNGYKQILLSDNEGNIKMYLVHRVVYQAVTGEEIPSGFDVNHINENKEDNRFENLNLMTRKENINFGTRNQRCRKQVGAFKDGKLVLSFQSTIEAQRQGFKQSNVSACCRNCFNRPGNNVYKGYEWRFI